MCSREHAPPFLDRCAVLSHRNRSLRTSQPTAARSSSYCDCDSNCKRVRSAAGDSKLSDSIRDSAGSTTANHRGSS